MRRRSNEGGSLGRDLPTSRFSLSRGVCTDIYSREPQGLYSCQMQAAAFDAAVGYPVASCRREWAEI